MDARVKPGHDKKNAPAAAGARRSKW